MGHSITWDNEDQTVVLQAYTDPVTKDDLYALVKTSAEMLKTCKHTVHLIIDERKVGFVFNSADLNYIERMLPPNQGAVVVVTLAGNITYKQISRQRMTQHIAQNETHFVLSVEEARALLQDQYGVRYCADLSDMSA